MPFIPLEVFTNQAQTTVTAGGTGAPASGTQETWTVASSASFPAVETGATQFHVSDPALAAEMIAVINVSGSTWTVIRGAEGSATAAHAAGFTVVQVVTAGALASMLNSPWQFAVQAYGAQGDGKLGTGGTGTSGTATFTDSGASFVTGTTPAGDVGKVIIINQGPGSATVATNPFCGTIIAVNSATSVTLSANLAATAAAAPYVYGTDDSAAITAAVNAATAWAKSTGNYKAQVMFEPQLYMLGALTQTNASPYTYNTHIPVPFATQYDRKLVLDFIGVGDASEPDFWGSAIPSVQGTCLVSAVFPASQPDATFGQMSVIGGPATQTGIGTGGVTGAGFGNVLVNVNGISVITPFNGQQYGFDFRWLAQANVQNAANIAFAPVNLNAQTAGGPWLRASNIPSNGVAVGLAMPASQNNDNDNVGLFSAEAISTGMLISEHFTAQRIAAIYCDTGVKVNWLSTGSIIHGGSIAYYTCEGCNVGISTQNQSGTQQYSLFVGNFDSEVTQVYYVDDQGSNLTGTFYWYDITQYSPVTGGPTVRGAQNYNIVNTRMYPGPWVANANLAISAPPAAPASATAQQNISYRPATVYASATTGITGVSVGPASGSLTALGLAAGNNVVTSFRVPGGHWYSVTYTGTLTVKWVLE